MYLSLNVEYRIHIVKKKDKNFEIKTEKLYTESYEVVFIIFEKDMEKLCYDQHHSNEESL